jgi:hypothetical protein
MHTTRRSPSAQPGRIVLLGIFVSLLMLSSPAAFAQPSSKPTPILDSVLRPGMTVWITDSSGREQKVRIVEVSSDAVSTSSGVFRAAEIRQVRERQADSVLNGALIGAGAFIGTGLFMCQLMEPWEVCNNPGSIAQTGALGAGIGIGVDALIRGRRTIYGARPDAARLHVTPLAGTRGRGVQVSLSF